jgi:hypothetical protein
MPPRWAIQEQYCQYVRALSAEEAGQLELGPDDKPITERARLKAAAKAEGLNLHIQRKSNTVVFWLSDEPPKTRTKAATKPAGDGGASRRADLGKLSRRLRRRVSVRERGRVASRVAGSVLSRLLSCLTALCY